MPVIQLRSRWKAPPRGRVVLDGRSPLASGLVLCVPWGLRGGLSVTEMALSVDKTGTGLATKRGAGRTLSAEGHEYASGPLSTEWTLMCFGQLGSGRSALISQCGSSAPKPQTYLCGNTDASFSITAGMLAFGCGSTPGEVSFLTASGAIDADPHVYFGLHRPNNTDELWRDGVQLASRAKTAVVTAADAKMRIEGINAYTGWYSAANTHILDAAWSRALSADELAAVGENPWQIFRADRRRTYSLGASGGASQNLAASGAATASGTASIAADVALAGVGVSLAGGTAQTAAAIAISALGLTVASGTATLSSSASGSLAASGSATAGGSASPVATVSISAAGLAQAAAQAGVSAAVLLAGAGAAAAAGNAALAVQLQALATGAAQASGSATIAGSAAGELSGYGQASATGAALLTLDVRLAAAGSAAASGSGTLSAGDAATLAASGGASASASGSVTAQVTVTAAGFAQAMGAGVLHVQIPLQATGAAQASGSAYAVDGEALVLIYNPAAEVFAYGRRYEVSRR